MVYCDGIFSIAAFQTLLFSLAETMRLLITVIQTVTVDSFEEFSIRALVLSDEFLSR